MRRSGTVFALWRSLKSGRATLYSRNGLDLSAKYPTICEALRATSHEAVFDGELVALDHAGRSHFQLLQNAEREPARLRYCVFDLLYLDRQDFRQRSESCQQSEPGVLETSAQYRMRSQPKQALEAYNQSGRIVPRSVELCEASAAVNDVKRPSRFEQQRDCLFPFRSEQQARLVRPEVA